MTLHQVVLETAGHQERRRQQHQGHGNLRHHQHIPAPQALASGHIHVGGLESVHQVHARALQRRRQAAKERAQDGQCEACQQHARVHLERHRHRQLGRKYDTLLAVEPLYDAVADGDPGQSTQGRENQAFGQQQPDEPETPGAKRQTYGDFARSRAGTAEKKSRNVGASHQQDRQRKDHKDHAEFPIVVFDRPRLELGVYGRAAAAIDLRIFALEIFREHGEFIPRLLERRARFQARLYAQFAIVAVLEKILLQVGGKHARHGQRHVEVGMPERQHPREACPEPRQSR